VIKRVLGWMLVSVLLAGLLGGGYWAWANRWRVLDAPCLAAVPADAAWVVTVKDVGQWSVGERSRFPIPGCERLYQLWLNAKHEIPIRTDFVGYAASVSSSFPEWLLVQQSDMPSTLGGMSPSSVFRSTPIYELNDSLYVSWSKGLVLVGSHSAMVEAGLDQLSKQDGSLRDVPDYQPVGVSVHHYFQPQVGFGSLFQPLLRVGSSSVANYWNFFESVSLMRADSNTWHGVISHRLLPLRVVSEGFRPERVLPDASVAVVSYCVSAGVLAEPLFSDVLTGEVSQAVVRTGLEGGEDNELWVYRLNNPHIADSLLTVWSTSDEGYRYEQALNHRVYHPRREVLRYEHWLPYYAVVDSFLVVGATPAVVGYAIQQYVVGQVLANSSDYLANRPKGEDCLLSLYMQPTLVGAFLDRWIAIPHVPVSSSSRVTLALRRVDTRHSRISIGVVYNNGAFVGSSSKPTLVWSVPLLKEAATPPKVLYHASKQQHLILVQDKDDVLYCFDMNGTKLWQRKLDGLLLSDFFVVDYYGNGAQHIVFNTAQTVYLLRLDDADTPKSSGFPRKLPNATAGLTLDTLERNGNWRYFIPCANNAIYGYTKDGTPLSGWNPLLQVGRIVTPIEHFLHDGKDYLVALNEQGKMFFFRESGELHFPPVELKRPMLPYIGYDISEKPYRVVAMDSTGKAAVVNLQGKFFNLQLGTLSADKEGFCFVQVKGSGRKESVVFSPNRVDVFSHDQRMGQYAPSCDVRDVFEVPASGGGDAALLGLVCPSQRSIWLIDGSGRVQSGFPLAGTTRFCTGYYVSNRFRHLIVADERQLLCYQIP
jgi:hypothetical protein